VTTKDVRREDMKGWRGLALIFVALVSLFFAGPAGVAWGQEEKDGEAVSEPSQEEESRPIRGTPFAPRRLGFGMEVIINLNVIPAVPAGSCPAVFTLKGQIYINKAATVLYKFVRSDRKQMAPVTLTFEKPGALEVTDTFRIGGDAPAASESWAFLEVVRPVNVKVQSNTVFFKADCGVKAKDGAGVAPGRRKTGYEQKEGGEECVRFNPADTTISYQQGAWKVGDGVQTLYAFGAGKKEAERTLAVIKRYNMDQSCFVGRPRPSFHYMLVNGSSPAGPHEGETCKPFNPPATEVRQVGGSWKVTDGEQVLFDFGGHKDQADQALALIRKYGFTHSCMVAPGRIDAVYMRR
jgi:hypothetical protein